MTTSLKIPLPRIRCQQAFFALQMAGYVKGVKPEKVERFENDFGTMRITWEGLAGWHGIDEWRSSDLGDGSNGTTSIYYRGHLIWEMQYGGFYPQELIPFLKRALIANYSESSWYGGRGPNTFEEGSLCYVNEVTEVDFADFTGREAIFRLSDTGGGDEELGYHFYRGGFLMNDPDK